MKHAMNKFEYIGNGPDVHEDMYKAFFELPTDGTPDTVRTLVLTVVVDRSGNDLPELSLHIMSNHGKDKFIGAMDLSCDPRLAADLLYPAARAITKITVERA